jgi:hypothetical protein
MKSIKQYLLALALVVSGAAGAASFAAAPTFAVDPATSVNSGLKAAGNDGQAKTCGPDGNKRVCSFGDRVQQVINVLLFIIGAVAVIMIIIGGIKYVLSNGDSSQITSAKNTILYAVIGLVVALLAYAIVNFVVVQFT